MSVAERCTHALVLLFEQHISSWLLCVWKNFVKTLHTSLRLVKSMLLLFMPTGMNFLELNIPEASGVKPGNIKKTCGILDFSGYQENKLFMCTGDRKWFCSLSVFTCITNEAY